MNRIEVIVIWAFIIIGSIWTGIVYVHAENPEVMDNPSIRIASLVMVPLIFIALPTFAGLMTAMVFSWFQKSFSLRLMTYATLTAWLVFMGLIWLASPVMTA